MSLPLTKICDPADLDHPDMAEALSILDHTQRILQAKDLLDPLPHPLRLWEYGQALRALKLSREGGCVLEVGGSTSLLMPAMAITDHCTSLTQCESEAWINDATTARWQAQMAAATQGEFSHLVRKIPAVQFDFIACISVVENIMELKTHEQAEVWIRTLVEKLAPGGILFLTSDIGESQPDNYMFSHMRGHIWDPESWADLADLRWDGKGEFDLVGEADFRWTGPHVYGSYNFASICLRRGA